MVETWVIIALSITLLAWVALTFNRLVRWRNRTEEAWSQIDVELRRRYDLVPQLVGAVQGYLDHERAVLERVADARAAAVAAGDIEGHAVADSTLTGALRSLFAVVEGYPTLRASEHVVELQRELAHTEDRIAYARGYYNAAVVEYETARLTLPANLVAAAFRFTSRPLFEADVVSQAPVDVALRGPAA
ncbi:MAG: LemA family protein [Dehalococcoidia bacterium]